MRTESKAEVDEFEFGQLPDELKNEMLAVRDQLLACGFSLLGNQKVQASVMHYSSYWINETSGDLATIIGYSRKRKPGEAPSGDVIALFQRAFGNGTHAITSNYKYLEPYPKSSIVDTVTCPHAYDIQSLYQFHSARASSRHSQSALAPLPQTVKEVNEHGRNLQRSILLDRGYVRLDSNSKEHHATLKGVYLTYWSHLWPLKGIRLRARNAEADQQLHHYGFGGLASSTGPVQTIPSKGEIG